MAEQHDTSPTRFWIERLADVWTHGEPHAQQAWLLVGHIDMEGDHPLHRDAFVAWTCEQNPEPSTGYYRVGKRSHGWLNFEEYEIREHRERVIERVEDAMLAADLTTLSRAALTPTDDAMAGKGRSDG